MLPILILQHLHADGPAYLATWLREQGLAFEVLCTEAGDCLPQNLNGIGALAILGGEMSANDDLPSLRKAEALFLDAVRSGIPTLGHCLGGQLMARALGGRVSSSPAPEVGWQTIQVSNSQAARQWFGSAGPQTVYHWHYETFSIPPGAVPLAATQGCPNQAFAYGPHLALQFHLELDAEKLQRWSLEEGGRYAAALLTHPQTVHTGEAMRALAEAGLARQQTLARRIYARWLSMAVQR